MGNLYFVVVIISKMFENDMATLAWWSIVLCLLCWGPLVVYLFGWFYSRLLDCRRWVWAWTFWWLTPLVLVPLLAA